jgi:hypothetical protein
LVNQDAESLRSVEATVIAFCADPGDLLHASAASTAGHVVKGVEGPGAIIE